MSEKLPAVEGRRLVHALQRAGFAVVRASFRWSPDRSLDRRLSLEAVGCAVVADACAQDFIPGAVPGSLAECQDVVTPAPDALGLED